MASLGMNAKLMYQYPAVSSNSISPSGMTEISNVRDLSLDHETGEADVTTRGNGGWRAIVATVRSNSFEFEMVWDDVDQSMVDLLNAWLSNGLVTFAIMSGNAEGDQGPVGNYSISNFSRSESLEEAIKISVKANIAQFWHWHTMGGELVDNGGFN